MKDDRIPLHDILKEIEFLRSIRGRSSFEQFRSNGADVRAASFSILVISEAVRRIPPEWLADYPETPWPAIRSIGNKLRHEYQNVSDHILWNIITQHADSLQSIIESMFVRHAADNDPPEA